MRVVWSIFVVCLVAVGGVARAEPRCEPRATALTRGETPDAVLHAGAARAVSHIAAHPGRPGSRSGSRSVERRLPLAALPAPFVLRAPPQCAVAEPRLAAGRVAQHLLTTCSARGPPVA